MTDFAPVPLLAIFDFNWTSTPWILYPMLAIIAFVVVKLLLDRRAASASAATPGYATPAPAGLSGFNFGAAPAPLRQPSLAPRANPHDVQDSLETLANLCNLEGLPDLAVALHHLSAGDESEIHRSIREMAMRFRSPRAVTAAARGIVLRHLAELRDDPEVAKLIASLK
jgi:hypothetical protein